MFDTTEETKERKRKITPEDVELFNDAEVYK